MRGCSWKLPVSLMTIAFLASYAIGDIDTLNRLIGWFDILLLGYLVYLAFKNYKLKSREYLKKGG